MKYHSQLDEIMGQNCGHITKVTCECKKIVFIHMMSKCFFCGKWLCNSCGMKHFGKKGGKIMRNGKLTELEKLKVRKSWTIGYLNKLRKKEIKWVIDELEYDLNDMNKMIADIEVKKMVDKELEEVKGGKQDG